MMMNETKTGMNAALRLSLASVLIGLGATSLSGCTVLAIGGVAAGATMTATDRRTTGTQLEDQLIELKARNRTREVLPDSGNVSATSYNRVLLVTGEVPTEANKAAIEATLMQIDNVRSVVNELAVRETAAFSSRSSDSILTGKVKATFTDARTFPINAVKVVSERGNVYLMGLVSEAEGNRAAELARGVGGVMRVVKVFETTNAFATPAQSAQTAQAAQTSQGTQGPQGPSNASGSALPGAPVTPAPTPVPSSTVTPVTVPTPAAPR
jgi:osmotically-inducible protein OsmY